MSKILIIIPCHNEAQTVVGVVEAARQSLAAARETADLLVVDDASTDGTVQSARSVGVTVLSLAVNSGVEIALHTGYLYAFRAGYDACIHVDGDGQHPAEDISRLLKIWRDSACDMVLTSRYLHQDGFRSTRIRRLGQSLIRVLTRFLYGVTITDPTSGFKLVSGAAMRRFAQSDPADYHEPISLSLITSHHYSFVEVPVVMKEREHGQSYLEGVRSLTYMIQVMLRLVLVGGHT